MFLGIDLGTSGVKALLLDRNHKVLVSTYSALTVEQPQPLWREQNPNNWWQASKDAVSEVLKSAAALGIDAQKVEAIGISGQMHGATLLNSKDEVLRPAILWNDGRSEAECRELEQLIPNSRQITGNIMMPGFTAPKLLWVAKNEPKIFDQIAKVLLPKDYLRLCLTGEYATDMSDAAGMLWLDVKRRDWSDELLASTSLSRKHMPTLFEGPSITGVLRAAIANEFGMRRIPVVAGAGDNAAGAIGMGIVQPGQGMLSLGTSGVFFVATDGFLAHPSEGVHSFCHALPETWHLMSVMLSASVCLDHTQRLTGMPDVASLLDSAKRRGFSDSTPFYLPYLNGERTPHNNPDAKAMFFGIDSSTQADDLANATLEGVGQGLLDGIEAVESSGVKANAIVLVGGGSRSDYWAQMLADIANRPLIRREGSDFGAALGAARLARVGLDGGSYVDLCPVPQANGDFLPRLEHTERYAIRRATFRSLYKKLESFF